MIDTSEVKAWRDAAMLAGESLDLNGPINYYTATPEEFKAWVVSLKTLTMRLEEMRERAARVCEDSMKWWPNRNMFECEKNPLELAKAIRELPVVPN